MHRLFGVKAFVILVGTILGIIQYIYVFDHSSSLTSRDVNLEATNIDSSKDKKTKPEEDKQQVRELVPANTTINELLTVKDVRLPEHDTNDQENDKGMVNPHPYNVLLSNPNICLTTNITMFVLTGTDHYQRRDLIRQTWGDVKKFPNMRVMFVMGKTTSIKMMKDVRNESTTYGDILQEDFHDTYYNLTYKGIAALKFISHYCNNVKYILKTDDDVFINMYTLQNHLMQLDTAGYNQNLILCLVRRNIQVMRTDKWAISKEMYPDSSYLPFCSGIGYLFTNDIVHKLYEASLQVKFVWLEDVFVSGILPRHINVHQTTWRRVYCLENEMADLFTHSTEWYKYVFTHAHDEALFLKTWEQLSKIAEKESIPSPSVIAPGVIADQYEPIDKVVKKKNKKKDNKKKKDKKKEEHKEENKKEAKEQNDKV